MDRAVFDLLTGPDALLMKMRRQDVESIGTARPSLAANTFLKYCRGMMRMQPHCFWGGGFVAMNRAINTMTFQSSHKIALVNSLLVACEELPKTEQTQQAIFAISRLFAMYSLAPTVMVYLSPRRASEKPGVEVGSIFWEAELPVLMLRPDITHIYISCSEAGSSPDAPQQCSEPCEYYGRWNMRIYHREALQESEVREWNTSPPRRFIYKDQLQHVISHWKQFADSRREIRTETSTRDCIPVALFALFAIILLAYLVNRW